MALDIASLKTLRTLDEAIQRIREAQAAHPARLRGAEGELAEAKKKMEAKREEIKAVRKQVDEKNRDIKGIEEKVDKLNQQVNTIKTNKEFQALQNEIQEQKAGSGRIEDAALVLMNREEELRKEEQALAAGAAEKEKALAALRKEVEAQVAVLETQIGDLNGKREGTLTVLDKDILALYRRILGAKKDGIALAPVDGGTCGVCSASLTSQEINLLMKNREVVLCRSCSRILYLDPPAK